MRLDWKRFQDLVRVLVTKAGYRARPVMVGEAGGALISLTLWEQREPEALLCCTPWDQPVVSGRLVENFHREVIDRGFPRGTIFTPGTFRPAAIGFRGERPIEMVGAVDFLETLGRIAPPERDYLFELTTAGDYDVPTCPACSVKMVGGDTELPGAKSKLKNLSIKRSETFFGEVRCNKLMVAKGAEARFLGGVYANKMRIRGRVEGNFTVSGAAEISNGAALKGRVVARSVELDAGGVLDGEVKMLDEEDIQPAHRLPAGRLWACPNSPKCPVHFRRRGGDVPPLAA